MRLLTLALMLGVLACRRTPPTLEPEPQREPQVFAEQEQTKVDDPKEPSAPLAPITPGECPAMIGDAPTAFFEERVVVRLPAGLEGDDLRERGPFLVDSSDPIYLPDCRDGDELGAMIVYVALTLQVAQDAISLEAARDFALNEFGYSTDARDKIIEGLEDPTSNLAMWVIADPDSEAKALIVLKKSAGFVVAMLFDTNEDLWPALVDTFVESGKHLRVVPG